jgi:flagellar basal-body rod protein FlgB
MTWMTTPMLDRLEKYLDLATFRQTLVASNLANIDTPGYRTQDIDFESEMRPCRVPCRRSPSCAKCLV